MKRWFDPWPVFFKREFNRTWPFLVGFAVTGTIITKFSLGLTGDPTDFKSLYGCSPLLIQLAVISVYGARSVWIRNHWQHWFKP
ncbi:ATP synthase 6 kDa subunit, mitochondrial [Gossypium australe]|uniref:ATP synthase 6 kDa subunit, mitochondrial n=1 Tax=Gossypium australe TaxID=47621 RepID=A0A5B6UKP5_9ROSI|nr:ATP synthase 6 kDa subunit, mitochondrial [Gossypium australe]